MKEIVLNNLTKRIQVAVPSFVERCDPGTTPSAEYTAYVCFVTDMLDRTQWKIYKRYNDFLLLYNQVKNDHEDKLATYKFPNKSMFNTFSQFTKIRRREGFDELLRILITINPLPQLVSEFLELDEHLNFAKNSIRPLNEGLTALENDGGTKSEPVNLVGSKDSVSHGDKEKGQTKLGNVDKVTTENALIIFPSEESMANSRIKSRIPSIFGQVAIIVITLYAGCVYFKKIEINESTVVRVVLTCITLILTFTFIKGSLEKKAIEKEIAMLRLQKGVNDS